VASAASDTRAQRMVNTSRRKPSLIGNLFIRETVWKLVLMGLRQSC
jgi:hypothetical protein